MKAMGKVTLTLGLMIIVSLFLTSCSGVVTPEISMVNSNNPSSNNPNSNNYQDSSTDPVEESATEESATEEQTTNPSSNNPNSNNYQDSSTDPVEEPETVEVDTTKPVITGSSAPPPNSLGWNNTDVTVSFSCVDTGAIQSGIAINTVAGETVTTEGKNQSVTNTGACIDVAGNTADPVTVSNINIDKTPPVVTITLPGTDKYVLNQSITATWSATDALSGVVSPVSGSVSIDTSSVGTKTFTLPAGTATDKAGNSSLKVTKSYSVIEDIEEPETGSSQKWSELTGFTTSYNTVEEFADTWLANGFTEIRFCVDYTDAGALAASKVAVLAGQAEGLKFIWGVTGGGTTITFTNWLDFRLAILAAAQWAQDNGVYEFQIGNEELYHNDDDTMTDLELIAELKNVATDVQVIFTSGDVSYSAGSPWDWIDEGKGDIDLLAYNVYMGGDSFDDWWKTEITSLVDAFGVDGTYITEFAPSWISLDDYSTDETVQAAGVSEMIDHFKASGITRALYYEWIGDEFGVIKFVGDKKVYRLLWNQALLNTEPVKFATVPTKTTTISLPDTIALIP